MCRWSLKERYLTGTLTLCSLLIAVGCASYEARAPAEPPMLEALDAPAAQAAGSFASKSTADVGAERAEEEFDRAAGLAMKSERKRDQNAPAAPPPADNKPEPEPEQAERTRSWFPEAFLWMPEIVTDASGTAKLDVIVPDQLTTWRLLALAHDGRGLQAGTLHQFDGTLPIYVDPVVPGWLYSGDRVLLPVQMTNTTDRTIAAKVLVEATGAMSGAGTAELSLGAAGSDVRMLAFDVTSAGTATITARLTSDVVNDTVERTIPVIPQGRPVLTQRGGTLAQSRTLRIPAPPGADLSTEQIEVLVFPGALSVLQLELQRLSAGARPENPAYSFALMDAASMLSEAASVPLDDASMRKLRILAWQRIVPATRAPDPGTTADLLASLRGITEPPQVEELTTRLQRSLAASQRADGTWSREDRSTLQRVLVDTAYAARALRAEDKGPRLRASAALERYLHEVRDPYTASVLLASGLADSDSADVLMKILTDAITNDTDGIPTLSVPPDVRNPWGRTPSRSEMLAWAVLALPKDRPERGDLAAQLMQGWSEVEGFGAGRADTIALEAVTSALGGVSSPVNLSLLFDGRTVATATLDPSQPKVPAKLEGNPSGNDVEITLSTSQGVPGLAFVATRRSYVPWSDSDRLPGVEIELSAEPLNVGRTAMVTLTAIAPSKSALRIEVPLPSGALVEDEAEQRLAGLGTRLEVLQDRIVLTTRPFEPGEIMTMQIPVTPSFAGRFQTAPVLVSTDDGASAALKPMLWSVGNAFGS